MNGPAPEVQRDLKALHDAADQIGREVTFMEVCGTHTMSAFRSGLHSLMPKNVRLLSGPGCPVCVTAQGDIDQMIELALEHDVTMCTYGDMLRVPGRRGSLEKARSCGADVRVVYSTLEAVEIAASNRRREVVFAAVGFETTAPATAAAVRTSRQRGIDNFSVLTSHKRVLPAMTGLLRAGEVRLDGFLCPGHVSVIIGWESYRPIVDRYGISCVIAGFEHQLMAGALAALTQQVRDGRVELFNQYPEAVTREGNRVALGLIDEIFEPVDMRWRGLGTIDRSGLALRASYRQFDAASRFDLGAPAHYEPRGCRCGQVITGQAVPHACELFGDPCTPIHPLGPCMVSSEGTCQAWFRYHRNPVTRESPGVA